MGNVVEGSMVGTMTAGAALVAARVGNGLYTDGKTGHVNYGNHHNACCQNPDMCVQGVTFAMWIKRGGGVNGMVKGIVLDTGGTSYKSKGRMNNGISSSKSIFSENYLKWLTCFMCKFYV